MLLILATTTSSRTIPSAAPPLVYHADVASTPTPFANDVVTKCFGSSHAATALTADWQRQLTKVHNEIGTKYVRFHGLLDDDMSVVIKTSNIPTKPKPNMWNGTTSTDSHNNCTFIPHRDYGDPAGPVVNASTQQECCEACYTVPTGLPKPCIAAVWTPSGQCYTKLSTAHPVEKNNSGIVACVSDRPSPKGYQFSFINIFRVFDFLLSIEMKPIVEISFMPSLLSNDSADVGFWYRGGRSPPKDFAEWRSLITALTEALVDRYGLAEIQSWFFEVWNEPNCGFYGEVNCCGPTCGNRTAYLELFTNTFRAVKAVDGSIKVGGPATVQLGWLDTFLTAAVGAGTTPDFLSTHLYPTDPYIDHSRDGMASAFETAAKLVATTSATLKLKAVPPILITEFNCGLGLQCADAPYAASFIAHQAVKAQQTTGSILLESYWTFSDIFEEQGQVPSEFSQAFGAQSVNGVPKPVYRAMQLLKRLQPASVAVTVPVSGAPASLDVTVTVSSQQREQHEEGLQAVRSVEVLVTNHVGGVPKDGGALNAAQSRGAHSTAADPGAVDATLSFAGCAKVPTKVELRRVDFDHANALSVWYGPLQAVAYPNKTALAALQKASEIVVESIAPAAAGGGEEVGSFTVMLPTMPSFAVAVVSFVC